MTVKQHVTDLAGKAADLDSVTFVLEVCYELNTANRERHWAHAAVLRDTYVTEMTQDWHARLTQVTEDVRDLGHVDSVRVELAQLLADAYPWSRRSIDLDAAGRRPGVPLEGARGVCATVRGLMLEDDLTVFDAVTAKRAALLDRRRPALQRRIEDRWRAEDWRLTMGPVVVYYERAEPTPIKRALDRCDQTQYTFAAVTERLPYQRAAEDLAVVGVPVTTPMPTSTCMTLVQEIGGRRMQRPAGIRVPGRLWQGVPVAEVVRLPARVPGVTKAVDVGRRVLSRAAGRR